MSQEAVRVEDRSRKQAAPILAGDQLAAVQVPGQDEVVTGMTGGLPDPRVMRAQDADMRIDVRRELGPADRDHSPPVLHARDAIMDPMAPATTHRFTHAVNSDPAVMVAGNGQNGCDLVELANQLTQLDQLGRTVHQVAAQQHHIRIATGRGIQYLPTQRVGATVPEVNVADIQQPTRVMPRRQPLFADMEGVIQPDFQRANV